NNINIAQQVMRNAELAALSMQLGQAPGPFDILGTVSNLAVNNVGGVLEALNGAISFDNANATKGTMLSVVGGDLLSQEVNVDAVNGQLTLTVGKMPGVVNVRAGCATVGALASDLNLGEMNITGDPTFYSLGDINLPSGSSLAYEADITLLAGRNIDLSNAVIDAGLTGEGFNITIVAGGNLIVS